MRPHLISSHPDHHSYHLARSQALDGRFKYFALPKYPPKKMELQGWNIQLAAHIIDPCVAHLSDGKCEPKVFFESLQATQCRLLRGSNLHGRCLPLSRGSAFMSRFKSLPQFYLRHCPVAKWSPGWQPNILYPPTMDTGCFQYSTQMPDQKMVLKISVWTFGPNDLGDFPMGGVQSSLRWPAFLSLIMIVEILSEIIVGHDRRMTNE